MARSAGGLARQAVAWVGALVTTVGLAGCAGSESDIPPGQDGAFREVDGACREQIPEPASRALTEAEANAKYDLEVESAECLAAGYPRFEFESREVWVAQWMAADGGAPDALVPDTAWSQLGPREAEQAQQACKMPTAQDIYERLNGG